MAVLAQLPNNADWDQKKGEDIDTYLKRQDALLKALEAVSDAVDPAKSLVGAIITHPVADGKAIYVVAKESPLTLFHVPYGDAYHDKFFVKGLDRKDVRELVKMERGMRRVFVFGSKIETA